MPDDDRPVRLPPRWFVRVAWHTHRGMYRVTGGRFGLRRPKPGQEGMMRLTTVGRRSGQERSVIVSYIDDGPNLVTMAMNGWADPEPAWWLNLQAHPQATVDVRQGQRRVRGRAAEGEERSRLWARWREIDENLDGYAGLRSGETALVILAVTRLLIERPIGKRVGSRICGKTVRSMSNLMKIDFPAA